MAALFSLVTQLRRVPLSPRRAFLPATFAVLVLVMLSLAAMANFTFTLAQHFTYLAEALLKGKLYYLELPLPRWNDIAWYGGHAYWPLGPFPAVLLTPFVYLFSLVHAPFYQGYLQFPLVLVTLYLVYRLARLVGYHQGDAWYLGCTFFSSAFFFYAWAPTSYYMAHVVVAVLWFAALTEYLTRRRYWFLGLLCGLALTTRLPAGLGIAFFGLELLFDRTTTTGLRWRRLGELATPFVVMALLLLLYNYARFGSILEQGYSYQIALVSAVRRARDYGLFSLIHLPGNLYYLFLAAPQPVFRDGLSHVLKFPYLKPDLWGMSIFITSPYLLYLLARQTWDRTATCLLLSCGIIALPILLYYGIGYQQFGYRYALDFMPLLYFLFLRQYRLQHARLSEGMKALMVGSAVLNLYLFVGVYLTLFAV